MIILFLQLLLPTALAADLAPTGPSVRVTVRWDKGEQAYHLLPAGGTLSFPTPGPSEWRIEIRQRLAGASQRASGSIDIWGNGVRKIMTIPMKAHADKGHTIGDVKAGIPSRPERASIVVPQNGKSVIVRAPADSRDILVRVFSNADPSPVVAKPVTPAARAGASGRPGVGATLGLGIPARGTKAVGYMGADGRYPVYKKLLSVGGAFGWYRIGVSRDIELVDTHLGQTTVHAEWHTDVFPVIARGLVHPPFTMGPLAPVAGAGVGLFIAKRVDGAKKTIRVGVGPELLAGAEMDLGRIGRVGGHLSWTEARMRLGNTGPDGSEVKETVAHTRLNLTWIYQF